MVNVDSTDPLATLLHGDSLVGMDIPSVLRLREIADEDIISTPVVIVRCSILSLDAPFCSFQKQVVLDESEFREDVSFHASYFIAGFVARHCHFHHSLDFQSGGHNKGDREFRLEACSFDGFVNFFDCWFEAPVVIKACVFGGGTNLFGNQGQPYQVTFDVKPIVEDTKGHMDMSGG